MAQKAVYAVSMALCVTHRAGIQPRLQPKPPRADFGLQPCAVLVCYCSGLHLRNPCNPCYPFTNTGG